MAIAIMAVATTIAAAAMAALVAEAARTESGSSDESYREGDSSCGTM